MWICFTTTTHMPIYKAIHLTTIYLKSKLDLYINTAENLYDSVLLKKRSTSALLSRGLAVFVLFGLIDSLRPSQQLWSFRDGQFT